jgi:hypothetical protein
MAVVIVAAAIVRPLPASRSFPSKRRSRSRNFRRSNFDHYQRENFMTKLDLRTLRTVSGGGGYHGGGNHAPVLKPILSVKASVSVS